MNADLLVAIAVFFTVLGLGVAFASLGSRKSARLQARLARHSLSVATDTPERTARVNVLGRSAAGVPFLRDLSFVKAAGQDLFYANVQFGTSRYFMIRLLLAVVAFVVARVAFGDPLLAAGIALVAFMIPRIIMKKKGARRAAAFEGLLAETLDVITGSLRAGQGLMQAIESTSQEQPEPMRSELRRIVDQVNMGMSISDAMGTLTTRFDSRDVDLLAAAIAINRESGGNLSEVLNNLAATVRQRRDIRAEAKSLTAAPRATSYMLAILPLVIAGYTTAISPIYREQLFHAPLGRALLIGACVWSLIGFFISQKLAKVEY
jgi:tight adherence protein B